MYDLIAERITLGFQLVIERRVFLSLTPANTVESEKQKSKNINFPPLIS